MENTTHTTKALPSSISATLPVSSIPESQNASRTTSQMSKASLHGEKLSSERTSLFTNPLINQQPQALSGFPNVQRTASVLILIDAMLAIYQKSSTQASNSLLTVSNNESSELNQDLTDLLNSSQTQQTIQNQVTNLENSDWVKYGMQALGVLLAFSLGCLIAGPVGGVIAASVAIGMDVMEDTGAFDDICDGIDNALGLSGTAAEVTNALIKVGTAVVAGLLAGGITSLASAGTAVAEVAIEGAEEVGEKSVSKGAKAVGKGVTEGVESGAEALGDGVVSAASNEVESDVEALEELGSTVEQSTTGNKKKASEIVKETVEEVSEETPANTGSGAKPVSKSVTGRIKGAAKSAWKLVPKLSPRAAMAMNTGIQVFNGFKTSDGSDGQEMTAVGDVMLACGASDTWAESVQAVVTMGLGLADMAVSMKAATDAPGLTSKIMANVTKWTSITAGVGEATLSGVSGVMSLRLAKVLKELAPITETTDELSGEAKEMGMEIQQTQQAFQTLLQSESGWAETTGQLINSVFSGLNTMAAQAA